MGMKTLNKGVFGAWRLSMRRLISIALAALLFTNGFISLSFAAEKPIKSNFSRMSELLNAMKAKGVNCSNYAKTPAELVIEEGTCQYRGVEILIDLWPNSKTAKDFAKAMPKVAAYFIETEFWPEGSKMFVFYSNNFHLSINAVAPDTKKPAEVAKVLQKKLGIKYVVGG
jgi:hypothetical protein